MDVDQILKSGEWNGFYLEKHRSQRGWMNLYIEFSDGKIKAEGTDYVGPWNAEGFYDLANGSCQWTKQYLGKHQVIYVGKVGQDGIKGEWKIGFSTGPFHIWPTYMTHLNELYLHEDLAKPSGVSRSDFGLSGDLEGTEPLGTVPLGDDSDFLTKLDQNPL